MDMEEKEKGLVISLEGCSEVRMRGGGAGSGIPKVVQGIQVESTNGAGRTRGERAGGERWGVNGGVEGGGLGG